MSNKQIFINLDRKISDEIKEKAARKEKRSLNSLARKLIADIPNERSALLELGAHLREADPFSLRSTDQISSTIRISEEELWDLKEKAAKARMNPRELVVCLLEEWNSERSASIPGASEKKNVVKRAS